VCGIGGRPQEAPRAQPGLDLLASKIAGLGRPRDHNDVDLLGDGGIEGDVDMGRRLDHRALGGEELDAAIGSGSS